MAKATKETYRSPRNSCCSLQTLLLFVSVALTALLWTGMNEYGTAYKALLTAQEQLSDCMDFSERTKSDTNAMLDSLRSEVEVTKTELDRCARDTEKTAKEHQIAIGSLDTQLKTVLSEKDDVSYKASIDQKERDRAEQLAAALKNERSGLKNEIKVLKSDKKALELELRQSAEATQKAIEAQIKIDEVNEQHKETTEKLQDALAQLRKVEEANQAHQEEMKLVQEQLANAQSALASCNDK